MADGTRNMTVGSPAGHLIRFALPLLAGSFLQQLYNMVDSFVVGRYVGDAALAAVGVGFPVLFMFTSLFTGLANGGTVVIAQALRRRESFGPGPERHRQPCIPPSMLAASCPSPPPALLLVHALA